MNKLLYANNVSTTLLSNIGPTDTAIAVPGGKGALFPSPTGGDSFIVTIENTAGAIELIECTGRAGDVLTVVRGREGSLASAFSAGDVLEMRVTAGLLRNASWREAPGTASNPALLDGFGKLPIAQFDTPLQVYGDVRWNVNLGYTPVQNGTGIRQNALAKVKIGWNGAGKAALTVDATDFGDIAFEAWSTASFRPIAWVPAWTDVTGKPTTFTPSAHTHAMSDISGLGAALANKLDISGGTLASLSVSGNLSVGGSATVTGALSGSSVTDTSDERTKESIVDMALDDAQQIVRGTNAVRYFSLAEDRDSFGVIAQAQESATPELIVDNATTRMLSMNYGRLTAPLCKVVADLIARVEELEREVRHGNGS